MRLSGGLPALAGVLLTAAAFAANDISAAFDGAYTGTATRNTALSSGACEALPLGKITISQGNLRSEPSNTVAWISGIVTADGYVKATMARPGGPRGALEGRLTGDTISGGFIESASMCTWQIELKRAPG